jgi:PilZ domain
MGHKGDRQLQDPGQGGNERRSNTRFPLSLDLRYTIFDPSGPKTTGSGRTIDLSSSGLSFVAEGQLAVGQTLDAAIHWPVLLDSGVQLQLILTGVVVRTHGNITALRIHRHEFRTRSLGPKLVSPRHSAR